MAIRFPKKLKIGAHNFTINYVKVPKGITAENAGLNDGNTNTITVDTDLSLTMKYETLWHEIMHAVNGELSENDIEFLAQAITQVLLDNDMVK